MTYILIIYLATYSANSGMTMTTAEFTDKASCEQAAVAAKKEFTSFATVVRTVCVLK